MKTRASDDPAIFFFACLIPLLATDLVRILITYYCSVDRRMWPLVLVFMIGVSFLYSGLAYILAYLTRQYDVAIALRHHALLGGVLVAQTIAFYLAKPDWLAVNDGLSRLTPLQSVIYSNWTPWAIYLLFYILLVVRFGKLAREG